MAGVEQAEAAYKGFVADELNVDAEELDSFDVLFEEGLLNTDLQPAVYGAAAGVGLSLLGGLLLLFRRSTRPTEATSAAGKAPAPVAVDEGDPEAGQHVKGSVWERSFDDTERTVGRIEDQPAGTSRRRFGGGPYRRRGGGTAGPAAQRRPWGQLGRLVAS